MNSLVAAPATPRAVGAPRGSDLASGSRSRVDARRTPAPALPSRALARPRDVRAAAWLGDWMRENFGDDESKSKSKSKGREDPSARRGLDQSAFAGAERVATASARRPAASSATRTRRPGAPSKSPPPAAFDELTPEELRPDFGLRRDLYDLYEVKSLDDEEPIGAGSYGIVRKVTRRSDGKEFALKTIRKAPWRHPLPHARACSTTTVSSATSST